MLFLHGLILKKLAHESLEHARMELRDRLLNYGKFKGYEVILSLTVSIQNPEAPLNPWPSGFIEVYTEDGETADSFIEREVFLRKGKYTNVYVVTSDGARTESNSRLWRVAYSCS